MTSKRSFVANIIANNPLTQYLRKYFAPYASLYQRMKNYASLYAPYACHETTHQKKNTVCSSTNRSIIKQYLLKKLITITLRDYKDL